MGLVDNLVGFPTILDIQRAYNWDVFFPSTGLLVDGIVIGRYCQAIRFGQYEIAQTDEVIKGVKKMFFPISLNIELITASFVSPVPDIVQLYFVTWKKMIVDEEGFYSPSSNYKKNIYVILSDRTGIPVNMIRLGEVFPVKFPGYNLSYASDDLLKYEVTFRVEKINMGTTAVKGAISGLAGALGM